MQERAIHISSLDRQKIGKNKAEDFITKFDPVLKLQNNMTHELALDKVTLTYSWHNISDQYQNNKIKYSTDGGNSWETVKSIDGMYTYSDLNDYLHQYMKKKGHKTTDAKKDDVYYINLTFVLSTYKNLIQIDINCQLDLRNSKFGDLIGFTEKIVWKTEYGDGNLPNITNSIDFFSTDMTYINTNAITNSIFNGINTNTLAVIPTDNLTRSFPFTFEPRRLLFNELSQLNISKMRFYITDSLGRPIGPNKIDWFMTLILPSKPE